MPDISWIQLGLPTDLLEQIDSFIGVAGRDRSDVIITLLQEAVLQTANTSNSPVLARLTKVEQELAEVKQAISDLQQKPDLKTLAITSPPKVSSSRVQPIKSKDVPDDWIEEPYEVLQGFLPLEEPLNSKKLTLAVDEAEHDFLEEPDEILTDFLEP